MRFEGDPGPVSAALRERLAPGGVLRAGINLSNFLLVSARSADGGPAGVSPDMAAAIAQCLDVTLQRVPYASPALLADAAGRDEWDIGLIGAEPQRAQTIAFTAPYAQIEATYLVPAGSPLTEIAAVDAPGVRIAVTGGTAYGLWLDRNIRHADIQRTATMDETLADFRDRRLEALAGLRMRLVGDAAALPGSRLLEGRFMAVQQAIGVPRREDELTEEAVAWLGRFVAAATASGFVAERIRHHGVNGLSVA
ncbi:MAG: transporter substrate-binding domain-containing protein [Bosea sp. (in: a-proteobacteria)]|uniref:transporter substrate-binding domain-containing protein n=1 Tax=Bosea sp. (in: a-proteobacteria) TaxID=1871050 RepID=UPI002732EE43|nr:transporter substrate-binding domain-containing protein [Bosea sp. (in: a-proteobacteria)]MBA4334836.1 ABC transporter substrate-binding protein [Methylobacterium sp.]MDP3603131.1 transporter substrate-binding domain-containing protein [Bosea sp. (in: a-proteobacteria)]WRH56382.1 MAG: transporter substrate-binding domain-containing protein [Bosea sp. (in: a-proteobacteria)]